MGEGEREASELDCQAGALECRWYPPMKASTSPICS